MQKSTAASRRKSSSHQSLRSQAANSRLKDPKTGRFLKLENGTGSSLPLASRGEGASTLSPNSKRIREKSLLKSRKDKLQPRDSLTDSFPIHNILTGQSTLLDPNTRLDAKLEDDLREGRLHRFDDTYGSETEMQISGDNGVFQSMELGDDTGDPFGEEVNDDYHMRSPSPQLYIHGFGPAKQSKVEERKKQAAHWTTLFSAPERCFILSFCEAEARAGSGQPFLMDRVLCCDEPQLMSRTVLCAGFNIHERRDITYCAKCGTLPACLVRQGFFPATPSQPRIAFAFDMLKYNLRVSAVTKTSTRAVSEALRSNIEDSGIFISQKNPFVDQLQGLIPWFDAFLRRVERLVDRNIQNQIPKDPPPVIPIPPPPGCFTFTLTEGVANWYLRRRCPACFGRVSWGGDPEKFPDVIVCLDANFQHRQYEHVKQDPRMLEDDDNFGWANNDEVEAAKEHVAECRTRNLRTQHRRASQPIPAQVLDDCEQSYKAAQEKSQRKTDSVYRVKGVMALVCAHDIPMFLCNVDDFGEPRHLAVALLRKLDTMLPRQATIGVMYDIADQLDRTIGKHDIVPELANRCSFALALFHAFGHRMQCQVVYNPRFRTGFGLTNGEGNERVWSLSRDIIGAERVMGASGPNRRQLTLARKMERIAGLKRLSYPSHYRKMLARISQLTTESNEKIEVIPLVDGKNWDRDLLRQEWLRKREDQLNAKDYNEMQLSSQVRSLLQAARGAQGLGNALQRIQQEISKEDFALTLFPDRIQQGVDLQDFVGAVAEQHQKNMTQLEQLTQQLGLASVTVPENVNSDDQRFLRLLIQLQSQKRQLWTALQNYQDEYAPILESSTRGGRSGTLGTGHLSTAAISLRNKSNMVTQVVKHFNATIGALRSNQRPAWVPDDFIPEAVKTEDLLRITQDSPLWNELFAGTPWLRDFEEPRIEAIRRCWMSYG